MSVRVPPRLVASATDVGTQAILVAAKAAGVELKLDSQPKSAGAPPELHVGDRVVRHKNAVLRYVGRLIDGGELCGSTFFESAEVDCWLDWAEMELGSAQPPRLAEAVATLEKRLEGRVFVVGQRFTLADVALSCSLHQFQLQGLAPPLPAATKRWLGTCTAHEAFAAILAGAAPAAVAPPPAPVGSRPAKGATAAAGSAAGSAAGPPSADQEPLVARYSSCVGGRTRVKRIVLAADGGESLIGSTVSVCGWVKTAREADKGKLWFIEINDGSCQASMQAVVDSAVKGFASLKGRVSTGASVKCTGQIVASPGADKEGKKQRVELQVKDAQHEVAVFGSVDAKDYPLSKKSHGMEFLRSIAHLRPRSHFIGCIARVRAALAQATHEFFRSQGFLYVHTPLITAADCEGAGEMFQVTTLLHEAEKSGLPRVDKEHIDYSKDFFGKPSFLTVSGQLSVENYCCSLSNVYTFGPTFRAENSHTSRHLAEFWMIEPELAFADINDDMQCAEDYLKYCVRYAMDHNRSDLDWFDANVEKGLVARLENLLAEPFARITYTEAIEILIRESPKANFQEAVEWGMDLGSEHERYLCEKIYMKPTIVYNYPKGIKAFYMRLNDDNETCAAMDCLAPAIGEVIGGSQREERLDVLDRRITEMNLEPKDYWWYRDLRRFGTVPHAGFGLGFERLIMLTTGVDNIRDVIPYPRFPGHAEF